MARKTYLKCGKTGTQWANIGDSWANSHFSDISKTPIICPVCGKRAARVGTQGYKHPGKKIGQETTYCKPTNGRGPW